jgi:hypothetical protein
MAMQRLQKTFSSGILAAWLSGIKEKIMEMTLNSSGIRDTGRVLSFLPSKKKNAFYLFIYLNALDKMLILNKKCSAEAVNSCARLRNSCARFYPSKIYREVFFAVTCETP